MSDDGLRRGLRAMLDARRVGPGFADRAVAEAVSSPPRRLVPRHLASLAVGTAAGVALAGVLAVAISNRGHSRPPAAVQHGAVATPSPSATATPPVAGATPAATAPLVVGTPAPTPHPTSTPHPTALPIPAPGARNDPAMTDDQSSNTVLLYGGVRTTQTSGGTTSTYLEDTWSWDGTRWTALNRSAGHLFVEAMAWDATTRQTLMIGATTDPSSSSANTGNSATYVWTSGAWHQLSPATPPVNFSGASMIYDARSGQIVLLTSGTNPPGSASFAERLYSWDGEQWTLLWTSPPGPVNQPNTLIGLPGGLGYAGLGPNSHSPSGSGGPGALYTFDGGTWTENDVPGTPGAVSAAILEGAGPVVVLGGSTSPMPDEGPDITSTFVYDGTAWTSSPLPNALVNRVEVGLADDRAGGGLVLTGGSIGQGFVATPPPPPPSDTWEWHGSWTLRAR